MFNLGGSSKARPAHYMLAAARAGGRLRAGQTLLIPSSGNTALALASLAAALGLPTTIVMPENAGPERIGMARVLGAAVELTPATLGSDGAYQHALALYSAAPDTYALIDQSRDPANWRAHFETTGPEIWRQTEGRITHFMAGLGTGGTLVGVARYLKTRNPAIRVIAAVPASAEERIPGLRYLGKGMTPPIYDASVVDEHFPVMARDAWRMAQRSAQYAGLAVGPSSGAALSVALSVAESLRQARIVVLYPDGIEKYLSALAE
jgi:cysteine synthase B